jgi:hypothetical protein
MGLAFTPFNIHQLEEWTQTKNMYLHIVWDRITLCQFYFILYSWHSGG